MSPMKNRSPSLAALEERYDHLRKSLAQIGYISQGSVLARSVATSGRSGYQWTRKVAQKTITVSLSRQQFGAMQQASRTSENFGRPSSRWKRFPDKSSLQPYRI